MAAAGVDFQIVETASPEEASRLSRHVAVEGRTPVAVGGDGSIHHVFSGLVEAAEEHSVDPTLGILPVGTGNDLARMLGIPLTLEDSLASLVRGASRSIDFGFVEWDDPKGGGRRPFINVAGIGLDARSAMLAVKLKPYLGNLCYTVAPALSVWTWERPTATIEVEDATGERTGWTGEFLLASVANGKWVGGGIKISPDAQIDDGLLDLCLIRAASPVRALVILPKAVKGRHNGLPEVDARPFRTMTIAVSRGSPIHLDGEPCTPNATWARFVVSSRRLVVVTPKRS